MESNKPFKFNQEQITTLDAFNKIADFSATNKVTRVKVEPRKFIDTSFLKIVDPKRVTLAD